MSTAEVITNDKQNFVNKKTFVAIQQVIKYHEAIEDYETCAASKEALISVNLELIRYAAIRGVRFMVC